MRKFYVDPEFEVVRIHLSNVILTPSLFEPEESIGEDIIDDNP